MTQRLGCPAILFWSNSSSLSLPYPSFVLSHHTKDQRAYSHHYVAVPRQINCKEIHIQTSYAYSQIWYPLYLRPLIISIAQGRYPTTCSILHPYPSILPYSSTLQPPPLTPERRRIYPTCVREHAAVRMLCTVSVVGSCACP